MSTIAVEAELLTDTTIGTAIIKAGASDPLSCGAGPQWWLIDIATAGLVEDTSAGGRITPVYNEFAVAPPEVPGLFVEIQWSTDPGRRGTVHVRRAIVDATCRSYCVFASGVDVFVVGPPTLIEYQLAQPRLARSSLNTVFGYFDVGVLPCCTAARSRGLFTSRFFVPAAGGTRIPVPAGSRLVQVHDEVAATFYVWASGSVGTFGSVVLVGGVSAHTLVPNATALVAPAGARDRVVTAVWEIDV